MRQIMVENMQDSLRMIRHIMKFSIEDFAVAIGTTPKIINDLETKKINTSFSPLLYNQEKFVEKIKIYSTDKALKNILIRQEDDFKEENLDRPNAWYKTESHNRRFGGFDNWIKYYNKDEQINDAFDQLSQEHKNYSEDIRRYREVIDNEILPLFEHKETSFSLIIPPYSALWWAKRKDFIEETLKPYEYLIHKTVSYPNVKIYWFYDEPFVFDISMYKDLTHYYYTVNSLQLDAVQEGTHIINIQNYQQKFKTFIKKVNAFNLEPYLQKVRKAIKDNEENKG